MSQITVTTLALSPEQLSAIVTEAVNTAMGRLTLPEMAGELEILKRKTLLTPEEVEKLYSLNARTLCNKRGIGKGPAYIQEVKNGPVFYEHTAIQAYLAACRKKTYA